MNRRQRRAMIGPFSWAVRMSRREPECGTAQTALRVSPRRGPQPGTSVVASAGGRGAGRRAQLGRLVPMTESTYHTNEMPKTECERVGFTGSRGEAIVRYSERHATPHPGGPGPANAPSRAVLPKS